MAYKSVCVRDTVSHRFKISDLVCFVLWRLYFPPAGLQGLSQQRWDLEGLGKGGEAGVTVEGAAGS